MGTLHDLVLILATVGSAGLAATEQQPVWLRVVFGMLAVVLLLTLVKTVQ